MSEITSSSNPQFKLWKSLLTAKGIRKEGLFLLSGEKLIREAMRAGRFEVEAELVPPRSEAVTSCPRVHRLSGDLFRELDEIGTHGPILVMRHEGLPAWDPAGPPQGLEILCPLGDPQNLGSLLRTAEAFGTSRVVLLEESAHPLLPKSLKASAGSSLRLRLEKGPSISELRGEYTALDLTGTPIADTPWPRDLRLLVGEEGPGLSRLSPEARIRPVSIPTQGVESLNATVATAIALFQYRTHHPLR